MKISGALMASVVAVSATALTSSSSSHGDSRRAFEGMESRNNQEGASSQRSPPSTTEKFAPRFDGLRFIETLVTAHR